MTHAPADHVHARLTIVLEGQTVAIPADIGVFTPGPHTPGNANPHTHDALGVLHMGEGGQAGLSNETRLVTLDDFFDVWRERAGLAGNNPNSRFDATHILDRSANTTHVVRMFVNGQLNTQFEKYTPHDKDDIVIRYDALPASPAGLVLAPASDSGFSNSDRITNATSWQIQVNGVTDGALVQLRSDTTLLGQATASGSGVTVVAAIGALSDGLVNVTAVQTIGGLTSPASSALAVRLDRAVSEFTLAPRAGLAGQAYSFDINAPEEGQTGFSYTLISGPAGASVAPTTGIISWSPSNAHIGRHALTVRANDTAGNSREVSANLYVVDAAVPWRNPVNPLDVNGDTNVFPLDVLLLVNRINNSSTRQLPTPSSADASPPFFDVTGNNRLEPIDVLQVINFINAQGSGEGELLGESRGGQWVAAAFNLVAPNPPVAAQDNPRLALARDRQPELRKVVPPATAQSQVASMPQRERVSAVNNPPASAEDWEQLLEQLAVDQLLL